MFEVKTISDVPALKSLSFLGLIKKAIYSLYVAEKHINVEEKIIPYQDFEESFLTKDIELQKIDIYNIFTMKLSNIDDAEEIIDCICNFIYQDFNGNKVSINRLAIRTIEEYREAMKLMLNYVYVELVTKKLLQP